MRVGANAGPLSVSGRPFNSPTLAGIGTFAIAWVVLEAAIDYRYVSVALAAVVGLAAYVGARSRRTRHARARDRQQQRARSWLAAPAPPLTMPSRFTQAWLSETVPDLHPGQIDPLVQELTARGWTPEQIVHRLGPLLARHSATRARLRPPQVPSREASKTSGATPADTPPSNGNATRTADPAPPARALSLALPAAASVTVRVGSADDGVNRQALSLREVARES